MSPNKTLMNSIEKSPSIQVSNDSSNDISVSSIEENSELRQLPLKVSGKLVNKLTRSPELNLKKIEFSKGLPSLPTLRDIKKTPRPEIENRDFTILKKKENIEDDDFNSSSEIIFLVNEPPKLSYQNSPRIDTTQIPILKRIPSVKVQLNDSNSSENENFLTVENEKRLRENAEKNKKSEKKAQESEKAGPSNERKSSIGSGIIKFGREEDTEKHISILDGFSIDQFEENMIAQYSARLSKRELIGPSEVQNSQKPAVFSLFSIKNEPKNSISTKTSLKNLDSNEKHVSYSIASQNEPEIIMTSSLSSINQSEEIVETTQSQNKIFDPNFLLFNSKLLSFSQIMASMKSSIYITEKLWVKKSYFSWLCCLSEKFECPEDVENSIFKVIFIGISKFTSTNQFHKDLVFTIIHRLSGNSCTQNEKTMWKEAGFSSDNYLTNEISKPGILLAILHLIYMNEYFSELINQIIDVAFGVRPFSLMKVALKLSEICVGLLRKKKLNPLILTSNKDPIFTILEFQNQVFQKWLDLYEKFYNLEKTFKLIEKAINLKRNSEYVL